MPDRLSKAERKKLRASLKNKGMFEEGLYAGHCDDLLDDLDDADAEIERLTPYEQMLRLSCVSS
jgi:hypothetical protein